MRCRHTAGPVGGGRPARVDGQAVLPPVRRRTGKRARPLQYEQAVAQRREPGVTGCGDVRRRPAPVQAEPRRRHIWQRAERRRG